MITTLVCRIGRDSLKTAKMAINQTPSPKMADKTIPLAAFTQQKHEKPLTHMFTQQGEAKAVNTLTMVMARKLMLYEAIAQPIDSMHRKVTASANARRVEQTRRRNNSTHV